MRFYLSSRMRLGLALLSSSLVSLGLYLAGVIASKETDHTYLLWNLLLAWVPLALALWLEKILRTRLWSSWFALLVTMLWLGFLPNSFYVITDLIHLQHISSVDPLFDVVLFTSFVLNGIILGYLSVYVVHQELAKRLSKQTCAAIIGAIFLVTSFAMYIGRDLRWNTWDVLFNPFSVVFDVSDRLINPGAHPQVLSTTISFFVLLTGIYGVVWMLVRVSRTVKT